MPLPNAFGPSYSGLTAEEEIAARVQGEMLPTLRNALKDLRDLQDTWLTNGLAQQVAAAVAAGTPIAGYSAEDWFAWGKVLALLLEWLDTPVEGIGATPRQILQKRYVKVQE